MTDNTHFTSYTVSYNTESIFGIIFQRWGSIWPKVFPYCIANTALMLALILVNNFVFEVPTVQLSKQGVTFISTIVAFLLVSRVRMGLARYDSARNCLNIMFRESREVIQNACVFSNLNTNEDAKEWRHEVAYRLLILLRASMAVLDYESTRIPPWRIAELNGEELEDILSTLFVIEHDIGESGSSGGLSDSVRRWQHDTHSEWEDTLRVPVRLAYLLKKSIHKHEDLLNEDPMPWFWESKLLSSVDSYMSGYYGIRKQITTPVPFPLVQMARTFTFLYVFMVPFVMMMDTASSDLAHCVWIFIFTYGFIGLELCAIELDDPFGDDENDFDNSAIACTAYEDTYLTVLDVDGQEWTDKLRRRMFDPETADELNSDQNWLISK